jgi:glycine/D-amino acid oxidase-like deaminating enzyme
VATNQEHSATLRETAANLPHLATWFGPSDKQGETWQTIFDREKSVVGALRLHSGCKVVHMPSYLKGLWSACNSIGRGKKEWIQNPNFKASGYDWLKNLVEFDAVVFAAGAGLFRTSIIQKDEDLPTQLVRGQSIEMVSNNEEDWLENALLCGKYVSPMLEKNRVLIGATHEFNKDPLDRHQVEEELKDRSHLFASYVWNGWTIDKITSGYRVQSNRGKHGRLPIIGRWKSPHHHNSWIFTGLSSRGLLYHGIFGDSLSDMMLGNLKDEDLKDYDWWRK